MIWHEGERIGESIGELSCRKKYSKHGNIRFFPFCKATVASRVVSCFLPEVSTSVVSGVYARPDKSLLAYFLVPWKIEEGRTGTPPPQYTTHDELREARASDQGEKGRARV